MQEGGGLERWEWCFTSPSTIRAVKDARSVREREERERERGREGGRERGREGGREREREREKEKERESPSHLSEKLEEVIDVCGPHGLCYVSLVLQMVFAGVGSVHLQPVKKPGSSPMTITLKHQLQHERHHKLRAGKIRQIYKSPKIMQ